MVAFILALIGPPPVADGLVVTCARTENQPVFALASDKKFFVCFRNDGSAPIKLLAEACSWGYEAISFDVVNPTGKSFRITRKLRIWDKNYPMPVPVNPGAAVVRGVDLKDGTWEGVPADMEGPAKGWKVRVVLNVAAETYLAQEHFWLGRRSSAWTAEADQLVPRKSDGRIIVALARGERDEAIPHLSGALMVAFSNPGRVPVTLLSEQCSWGYDALSFEVANPSGKVSTLVRAPKEWYRNFPMPVLIPPGGTVLRPVNFADHTWQGFPAGVAGETKGCKVRAVLTMANNPEAVKRGYWIGRQASWWGPLTP